MEPEKSMETHCPKCGFDWEAHEFAVPAPYCPGGEEDAAANRASHARFMARLKDAQERRLDVTNVKERGFTGTYEEIEAMYAPLPDKIKIICKCCGKEARWCGEGANACGTDDCPHIHCDHCGMHYSLESEAVESAETVKELRGLMLAAYNGGGAGE